VPGVSSSIAAPGLAGIPPTQRGVADQVLIATGKRRDLTSAQIGSYVPSRTVVLLMAMHNLDSVTAQMIQDGFPSSIAAAVVEKASLEEQRVVKGTLANIAHLAKVAEITSHATCIIGNVVDCLISSEDLNEGIENDNLSNTSLQTLCSLQAE
jgi:uroporphyrin-III C-methyltransferase